MGQATPKQYLSLAGKPMLHFALRAFAAVPRVNRIVLALAPDDTIWRDEMAAGVDARLKVLRCGGDTRADTVRNALDHLMSEARDDDWVLTHDAARAGVSAPLIARLMDAIGDDAVGGLIALPLADTLKRADAAGRVAATLPREGLWCAQTPQMFRFAMLRSALHARRDVTDEAQAIEALGHAPKLVEGEIDNFKITRAADLALAQRLIQARQPS